MLMKALLILMAFLVSRMNYSLARDAPHWQYDKPTAHPCNRECVEGKPMTCYYKFVVEKFYAMSKACYDCPRNLTDCYRDDCITMDGYARSVMTVNRRIPGPSIEVCLGDEIVVDVENLIAEEVTSIHWHGHHQTGTPYMDGVSFITQCPISPLSVFRYKMKADNRGTLFWHAHTGVQRADGLFGALVVRTPDSINCHRDLYDRDLSEHIMIIHDWNHLPSLDMFTAHVLGRGNDKGDVIIVNGRGRYYNDTKRVTDTPLAVFKVKKGLRYRFRLINSGVMNCPVEMYIDKHNVTFISTDGGDFDPVKADSLVSYAGERWDFVLHANQKVGNYWIRFTGLLNCGKEFTSAHQVAVLHYEGAPEVEPQEPVGYDLHPNYTLQVNPVNKPMNEPKTINVPKLHATNKSYDKVLLKKKPDIQVILSYDFNSVDVPLYHKSGVYGFFQVNSSYRRYTPQFNYTSFKLPPFPLLSQYNDISKDIFCPSRENDKCKTEFCECTKIIEIPLNSCVELVLTDKGKVFNVNHPFHLHGYAFRVLAMDRLGNETDEDIVERLDKLGGIKRNLQDPPFKDTVVVPDGGYTILRFTANNPGYWLFHCHIEYHLEEGMAVVFKIGEHQDLPPPPEGFPKCGDFLNKG